MQEQQMKKDQKNWHYQHQGNQHVTIFHPAAGLNWIASYNFAARLSRSFLLRINDINQILPNDGLSGVMDSENQWVFNHAHSITDGSEVFTTNQLDWGNMLVFEEMDGAVSLPRLDPVDIMFIDWLDDWLVRSNSNNVDFRFYARQFVSKIRDGGYIILDLKHDSEYNPFQKQWFSHPLNPFAVDENTTLTYEGEFTFYHEVDCQPFNHEHFTHVDVKIFKVNHRNNSQ
ncbi:MAG TPA: hypothetical protein EYQ73_00710 [Candidatus Poseidoniales archaeon]|jgi:hypothetical protein|nr:MAG: hypothetical protein CXT71_08310 [Euryarchaeota archaeon]HIF45307.1 hypothetical protein [Candidatus Poseidoniales archaeon]HIL65691.1 hypothetical protein [Candidatus Poseidoniales archaeon]